MSKPDLEAIRAQIVDAIKQGITGNYFRAERALLIYREIGANAERINKDGYGAVFGGVQEALLKEIVTSIAAIYEPSTNYKLRSIPCVLDYLRSRHAHQALNLELEALKTLVEEWQAKLDEVFDETHKDALCRIRDVRNKRMAHDELIAEDKIKRPTWEEIEELLEAAKAIHADMGFHLLRIIYRTDDGTYFLSGDAQMAQQSLKRLLNSAFQNDKSS